MYVVSVIIYEHAKVAQEFHCFLFICIHNKANLNLGILYSQTEATCLSLNVNCSVHHTP